ncbi:TolC family protein [Bacteroidota bacterium]
MKNKTFILLAILFSSMLQAQEMKSNFSLKEAINYALKHNRKVKNADLNIQAAEKQKWETTATGLPQINGKIEYQRWLKQQFPGVDFNQDGVIDFGAKQSLTPSITISQLIFDGTYIVALQASKVFLDISKNAKEKIDNEIKKAITNAYSNALLTKESITIIQKNILNLQKNLDETELFFQNGLIEEENVEQLQLTLNDLENNLSNLNKLETVSLGYMKLLLGVDSKTKINLTDNLESLALNNVSLDLTKSNHSIFENIDYKIAQNESESKRLLYKAEKYRTLPTLSAFLNTNYIGNSEDFTFLKSEQTWIPTSMIGVNFSMPIFTSFQGRAKRQRAKIDWEISQNNLADKEDNIKLDILKIKNEYSLAISTYENKQKKILLAERIENKNAIKFKEGLASSFDLRQAQTQLYNSQQEYLQAMVNVINKKVELENILNTK